MTSATRPRPYCAAAPEIVRSSEMSTFVPRGVEASFAVRASDAWPRPFRSAPAASTVPPRNAGSATSSNASASATASRSSPPGRTTT